MSTTEEQALQAQKAAQEVAEYHSKLATPSKIGLFSKLNPKIRSKIYASLFEDVLQPEESNTPCPCRLTPGECGHRGSYVYKPLKHLRPSLALLTTCKLFRNEAQALLHVEYIPKTAWVVCGKDGPEQLRRFLRCIRPQEPGKMLLAWRLEDVVVGSHPVSIGGTYWQSDDVSDWLAAAMKRHDQVYKEEKKEKDAEIEKQIQKRIQEASSPPSRHPERASRSSIQDDLRKAIASQSYRTGRTGVLSTKRFYLGHQYVSSGEKVIVVVNGPMQRLFFATWEMGESNLRSRQGWERIVRM
jgi:hypothetical protein